MDLKVIQHLYSDRIIYRISEGKHPADGEGLKETILFILNYNG